VTGVRVVLYTGKGGVGKTTTAAATAAFAAERGRRTLVASADSAHSLGDVFERRLGPRPSEVAPRLDAVEVDAQTETERHWGSIRSYLVSLFRHQGIEDVVADELALLPGAEELTTLLAVEEYARSGGYDFVVVDCAPTGSALRLVTLPELARGALRVLLQMQRAIASVVTPLARAVLPVPLPGGEVFRDAEVLIYRRLSALRELLGSPRTSVRLVVTPERMVIDEALRAHTDLALYEVPCDAVVMNRLLPESAAGEAFFRDWGRVQAERLAEVEAAFAPLPVLRSQLAPDEVLGAEKLARLGAALFGRRAPDTVLCRAQRVRFESAGTGVRALVPLPHADAAALGVAKVDDQLVIETPSWRRLLPLPRRAARLELASARLEDGVLRVELAPCA
jgi:arsenite-transporting ATPase